MTLLSPGIEVVETDLTTIIPTVGTSTGGFAGTFAWGPIEEVMTVGNELELLDRVGPPDSNTFISFFTSANFLTYTNNLKLVRSTAAGLKNAVANGSAILIKNETDYTENYSTGANTYGMWAAKYAGDKGNSLKVSMFPSANSVAFGSWVYNKNFDSAPSTSEFASGQNGSNDEIHIVVVDEDGKFTGTANTVLERFGYLSKASDAKNSDGTSNYYKNVINSKSKYIWWMAHPDSGLGVSNATSWGSTAANTTFGSADDIPYTVSLSNGVMAIPADANTITAFEKFTNKDEFDISVFMTGDGNATVVQDVIQDIAEVRMDSIVCFSPPRTTVVDNAGSEQTDVTTFRNTVASSSYAVMDSGWKYQYDKYNDTYRWIPLNGDVAGLVARTTDPWISPAGLNRGHIKNVYKLAWSVGSQADRDELYKNGINPVVSFLGEGPVLYGDKTLQSKPSAFDRINVRRLFITLEKSISKAAKYSLFEFNDQFTRAQFVAMVEPYLRDVKGRRGIYDYRVVCDETNNTPEVIDANQFVGDIYIKPARSINFIRLNFVAVRTGVNFSEVVGSV